MTMQSHQISRPKTPRRSIFTITAGLRSCTELSTMRPPEHIHRLGHLTKLPRSIRRSSAEDRPTQISAPAVHASAWQTSLPKNLNHSMMRPHRSGLPWLPQRDDERPSRFAPRRDDRLHPPDAPDVRTHLRFVVIILVHSYAHRRGNPSCARGGRKIFLRGVERMAGEQEHPPPCISLHQPDEFRGQPTGLQGGFLHTHAYTHVNAALAVQYKADVSANAPASVWRRCAESLRSGRQALARRRRDHVVRASLPRSFCGSEARDRKGWRSVYTPLAIPYRACWGLGCRTLCTSRRPQLPRVHARAGSERGTA